MHKFNNTLINKQKFESEMASWCRYYKQVGFQLKHVVKKNVRIKV